MTVCVYVYTYLIYVLAYLCVVIPHPEALITSHLSISMGIINHNRSTAAVWTDSRFQGT